MFTVVLYHTTEKNYYLIQKIFFMMYKYHYFRSLNYDAQLMVEHNKEPHRNHLK